MVAPLVTVMFITIIISTALLTEDSTVLAAIMALDTETVLADTVDTIATVVQHLVTL
jgi:hypothetical protein